MTFDDNESLFEFQVRKVKRINRLNDKAYLIKKEKKRKL